MRILLFLALLCPLAAQTASQEPAAPAPETPPAAGSTDNWLTGSLTVGYRWTTNVGGNFDEYRSVVNLGSGPKLLSADFTILDPKKKWFDRIDVRAYNWGGDPYESLHVDAQKSRIYDFTADYRNIAYFSAPPSYADPLLQRGIILNENSYDTHQRISNLELDLLPGTWLVPYLAWEHNSQYGTGVTTFVTDGNEFPLPDNISNSQQNYRGGIRLELRRFHVTLEQGGTTFKDDQQVFSGGVLPNPGNNPTPVFGQPIYLSNLYQLYGVRGSSIYTRGLVSAQPAPWIDITGQFLYSEPQTTTNYQQFNTGSFVLVSELLFYTGQEYLVSAVAKLPHTSGSLGVEIRPGRRVRILESLLTDRLHNASSSSALQVLTPTPPVPPAVPNQMGQLAWNYNQERTDVIFQITKKLSIRGGFSYVWGNASDAVLPVAGLLLPESGKLGQYIGLGGAYYRPFEKLVISGDVEGASSNSAYFRTSLYDYQKMHARGAYQISSSFNFVVDFGLLHNTNPTPGINYDYLGMQTSASIFWTPKKAKGFRIQGTYTRSTIQSNIYYLVPQTFQPAPSFYRDNAHLASALLDIPMPKYGKLAPSLSCGGSLFISSGSRPTTYYQPVAHLALPINEHLAWVSDWQYYGMGEAFYIYEGFRTNLVSTGLKWTK